MVSLGCELFYNTTACQIQVNATTCFRSFNIDTASLDIAANLAVLFQSNISLANATIFFDQTQYIRSWLKYQYPRYLFIPDISVISHLIAPMMGMALIQSFMWVFVISLITETIEIHYQGATGDIFPDEMANGVLSDMLATCVGAFMGYALTYAYGNPMIYKDGKNKVRGFLAFFLICAAGNLWVLSYMDWYTPGDDVFLVPIGCIGTIAAWWLGRWILLGGTVVKTAFGGNERRFRNVWNELGAGLACIQLGTLAATFITKSKYMFLWVNIPSGLLAFYRLGLAKVAEYEKQLVTRNG